MCPPNRTRQPIPGRLLRPGYRRLLPILLLLLLAGGSPTQAQEDTPATGAMPQHTFDEADVMQVIARLDAETGAPGAHASVTTIRGYMVQVYGNEEEESGQRGILFFDIADPTAPKLVSATTADTADLSEQHAIGHTRRDGRSYAALLADGGIQIWDWTDIQAPAQVSYLRLPGLGRGYARGAWWLFWQAPYLYLGGASNGLYIIDTTDPANPTLADRSGRANPLPMGQLGGFRIGPVFAVGNRLVLTSNDGPGYAILDISDPLMPVLRASLLEGSPASYSSMVNGNRIYAAGTDDRLYGFDISDPARITPLASADMGGRGGYLTVQDGFAHVGASNHYAKVDVRDDRAYRTVGRASSRIDDRDEDFAVVLGNLVVLSDDHGKGSFLIPHQAEADTQGPVVTMVSPADQSSHQAHTSRIGLTFSDQIDLESVNTETFSVRPVGGDPLPGQYSGQTGIVNFTPETPLDANMFYEIEVPAGGIRDISGNPVPTTFRSSFATGEFSGSPVKCTIRPVESSAVDQPMEFAVHVEAATPGMTYLWNFGDDTPPGQPVTTPTASHRYAAPGHYTVRVVVGTDDFKTSCATQAAVHYPFVPGYPASASSIIFDPDRLTVWVANPDHDTVTAINAVTLEKRLEEPVGRYPRTLALAPDGTVWVVNQNDATISVLDAESGAPQALIPLPPGSRPYGIIAVNRALYVTLQDTGQVLKLDPASRAVTAALDVGPTPRGIGASHLDGRIFVARYLSPDSHGEIVEIQADPPAVVRTLALAFDPGPDAEDRGRGVPNALQSPVVSPDGRRLWVPSKKDNIARGLLRDGQALTFDSTVRPIVSQIDLLENREVPDARVDFNDRDMPVAVRFSPQGDYAFVALQGSNAVDVLDVYSGRLVTALEDVGHAPQSMALTADGSKLFVHAYLSRSVLVYDVKGITQPGRDQKAELLKEIPTVAAERLDPQVLAGKRLFFLAKDARLNRDGYIACASCHVDEGHDGRVWDRTASGEGLRNTMDLRSVGNGLLDGPLHWSGNFDEVQDFEHDLRALFGGKGLMADADFQQQGRDRPLGGAKAGLSAELDALAAYVASLRQPQRSPHRNADGSLTADGQAGRVLFNRLGCTACHAGPRFTDSARRLRHDVGTLTPASGARLGGPLLGLDTPSLVGLWATAPYLHDGSAAGLRDVLTGRNPAGRHGATGDLGDAQLDQLVAYLMQIDDLEPGAMEPDPAVVLVRPQPESQIAVGETIRLAVNTTGSRPVAQVRFLVDDSPVATGAEPLYSAIWQAAGAGRRELRAQVIYQDGGATLSAPVAVVVTP